MPRSMWNGGLAFGAVTVPVKVFAATDPQSLHMRELHAADGAPIAHRRFDSGSGEPVSSEETVRGVEVEPGEWVLLSREEIAAAEHPRRRAVEIEAFVPESEIDAVYYDRAYNLAPQEQAADGYLVLREALRRCERVAIGRVVLRSRERLVAIRATEDVLRMHTMRFQDELVPGSKVRIEGRARKPSAAEVKMALALIDTLSGDFEPSRLRDTYRRRVLALARSKARGEAKRPARRQEPTPTDDLLEALRASVAAHS